MAREVRAVARVQEVTTVLIRVSRPSAGGNVPAEGTLRWTPSRRREVEGDPDVVILPQAFTVRLDDDGDATVAVDPTGVDWAWMVTEKFAGMPERTRWFAVPAIGPIDYGDLVTVDPGTLAVVDATPSPQWYAYVMALAAGMVQVVTVITGSEPRPETSATVFWIGGSVRPGNMLAADVWFRANTN